MKARIKETGRWITIDTCIEGFYDVETHNIYEPDELDFASAFDWDSFRRETAKDVLCAIIVTQEPCYQRTSFAGAICDAIKAANELIKQLKEEENGNSINNS